MRAVDAQRNYPDDSDRWYSGDRGYGAADWDPRAGEDRYPPASARYADDTHRVPDPRPEPGYEAAPDRYGIDPGRPISDPGRGAFDQGRPGDIQTGVMPPLGPRSGEPLPPLSPAPPRAEGPGLHGEPPGQRRQAGPVATVGAGVYRARRPAVAILLGLLAAAFELPALRVLLSGSFGDKVSAAGVVSGTFLVIGLPIFAMGLYAVVTGAGRLPGGAGDRPWLRPPLGYLTVGVALFIAAALAAA